jgi:hypothetical protein
MTARIKRNFSFQAGVYFKDNFYLNMYTIVIYFDIETTSAMEQFVSMERIKYFFSQCLENSILVNETNSNIIEKYVEASLKVCTLPTDPFDQIVAIMLVKKLNTILEGRMLITDISVTSLYSDDIHHLHSIEENFGPFAESGWWSDSSPKYNNINSINSIKSKKLVKLVRQTMSWDELSLSFDIKDPFEEPKNSEIVFVNFDKKKG